MVPTALPTTTISVPSSLDSAMINGSVQRAQLGSRTNCWGLYGA